MSDRFAGLGHWLDILLGYLGIHGLDAGVYILGVTISFGFGAGVRSAIRIAFPGCSARR